MCMYNRLIRLKHFMVFGMNALNTQVAREAVLTLRSAENHSL